MTAHGKKRQLRVAVQFRHPLDGATDAETKVYLDGVRRNGGRLGVVIERLLRRWIDEGAPVITSRSPHPEP